MTLIAETAGLAVSDGSSLLWIWGGLSLLIAALVGFFAGVAYGRTENERLLGRAKNNLHKLFAAVTDSLNFATEACRLLEGLPTLVTPPQADSLQQQRQGLVTSLDEILNKFRQSISPPVEKPVVFPGGQESPFQWELEPEDRLTKLPDHVCCPNNVDILQKWAQHFSKTSSLLLVRIDKFEMLRERYGIADSQQLVKRLSGILCRSVRDQDLVCRSAGDTFAILMPGMDREGAEKFSVTLRNTVSNSRFQLSDLGPDVLLTVSLGFTLCLDADTTDSIWARAQEALARSQRLGRNQLHVHDGAALLHCVAD